MSTKFALPALATFLFVALAFSKGQGPSANAVFQPMTGAAAKQAEAEWQKTHRTSKRAQAVQINGDCLTRLEKLSGKVEAEVELLLFDEKFIGVVHRKEASTPEVKAWNGIIKGQPDSFVSIFSKNKSFVLRRRPRITSHFFQFLGCGL